MRYIAPIILGLGPFLARAQGGSQVSSPSNDPLNVVYWGQNSPTVLENNSLAAYCKGDSGIDILVLSFLYEYGTSGSVPAGQF